MITPSDIQEKEFSNSIRGYNRKEVDEFLDALTIDFKDTIEELEKVKKENSKLNEQMDEVRKSERSVANTLEQAKRLMSDISESAEKRAEAIITNARIDAQNIMRDAKESVASYTEEAEQLQYKIGVFKTNLRTFLEGEFNKIDGTMDDLFSDIASESYKDPVVSHIPLSDKTVNLNSLEDVIDGGSDETASTLEDEIFRDLILESGDDNSKKEPENIMTNRDTTVFKRSPSFDDKASTIVVDEDEIRRNIK